MSTVQVGIWAMPGSRSSNNEAELSKSPRESGEDSEDESEILEESPGGRWAKRREEVSKRFIFFFSSFCLCEFRKINLLYREDH